MNKKITRVLSIDGGGIRGILPATILQRLEEKLKKISHNPEARLSDYFDLIGGTSSGGILTCLYLNPEPRYSAEEAVNFYEKTGGDIFHQDLFQKIKSLNGMWDDKYSVKNLEQVLFNYFKFTRLSQLTSSCVITAYDVQERKAHFFTKHNAFKAHKDFYVKDICRASSAAPSYFEVARIKSMANKNFHFIDGGVFANNPALCAYAEARTLDFDKYRKRPTAKDLLIFSIGSGKIIDSFHFKKTRNLGAIGWAKYIIDIMMGGTSNVVDYELRQIFDAVESLHHYFRLEPELFQASNDLDDASAKNIKALRDAGHQNALMHDEKLEQIAKLLIENE